MKEFPPARLRSMRRDLISWYHANKRDLPWRHTRDPYRIWISEIMLQQTRVAAVIPYYDRFLKRFPDPPALANASDDDLLAAWAGLGYYSRARNLRLAARAIVAAGAFPSTHHDLLRLPGIGPYSAAAIASFAFHLPHAVLDGNVIRVLARLTADQADIRSPQTRNRLQQQAQSFLDPADPASHNQAIMELGATVCVPGEPKCNICPLSASCLANSAGLASELPIKLRTTEIRRVTRTLLVAIRNGNILLWQRAQEAAMLGGFWELPEPHQLPEGITGATLDRFNHAITNHIYDFHVIACSPPDSPPGLVWTPLPSLSTLPLSTVCRKALTGARVLPLSTTSR